MKKLYFFAFLLISPGLGWTQNDHKLSFDFGYAFQDFSLTALNQLYVDDSELRNFYSQTVTQPITAGSHFQLGINYSPKPLFDFGIYGSYQFGFSQTEEAFWLINKSRKVTKELSADAIGVGISTSLYVSQLLKFHEKQNAWNKFHFGLEINGGIGFSHASMERFSEDFYVMEGYYKSHDFQGQMGLKTEYDLSQSPIATALGFRIGYQYYRTKNITESRDVPWAQNVSRIPLDFSGVYFGMYLKIGR